MHAVDTNILVRFLANDDARQSPLARDLLRRGKIWISKTVILETAWVLGRAYKLDDAAIRVGLAKIISLPSVEVEDSAAVTTAILLGDDGIDFADALHLASRPTGAGFVTFDRALITKAKRAGQSQISSLPV